jgi:hypothetical protein
MGGLIQKPGNQDEDGLLFSSWIHGFRNSFCLSAIMRPGTQEGEGADLSFSIHGFRIHFFERQQKSHARERMAETSKLFAPYDGITRFRFKGSSDVSDLSANGSPAFQAE